MHPSEPRLSATTSPSRHTGSTQTRAPRTSVCPRPRPVRAPRASVSTGRVMGIPLYVEGTVAEGAGVKYTALSRLCPTGLERPQPSTIRLHRVRRRGGKERDHSPATAAAKIQAVRTPRHKCVWQNREPERAALTVPSTPPRNDHGPLRPCGGRSRRRSTTSRRGACPSPGPRAERNEGETEVVGDADGGWHGPSYRRADFDAAAARRRRDWESSHDDWRGRQRSSGRNRQLRVIPRLASGALASSASAMKSGWGSITAKSSSMTTRLPTNCGYCRANSPLRT